MGRELMCKCRALSWIMLFRRISFSPYWTHQKQQGRKTAWPVDLSCSRSAASPYREKVLFPLESEINQQ